MYHIVFFLSSDEGHLVSGYFQFLVIMTKAAVNLVEQVWYGGAPFCYMSKSGITSQFSEKLPY